MFSQLLLQMCDFWKLTERGLLLFIGFTLIQSHEVNRVAIGSNITFSFKPCKLNTLYKIHHDHVAIHIPCNYSYLIPDKYEGRVSVKESTGRVTISNITKRDGGIYTLEYRNGDGLRELYRQIRYEVHDLVWIKELSRNDTGTTISFTVVCDGEPDAVNWTMDGEDLGDGSWLSHDNRTLAVPNNITATFTVHVSNLVSADSKNITLINDLNGKSNPLGVVMYPNITKVIWAEGGGRPSNQTLVLSRNVTNLYVLTPSEVTILRQDRDRFIILPVLSISLLATTAFIGLLLHCRCSHKGSAATGNT
ncbi:pregnancy-specific beta-1-glycoprotein 9-like isoform X1 [Bufo bufo]|uniref:pregnancy-specific beta-1-glycoprotein 9-like isoform X1 n=1 Tax=Bufo bufo TaxID=8384 RepID=UPI001ABDD022|nr:pregnancy-specific beta-1-glycoprotein 9-like isoform X1 [Bufo bufo]